MTPARFEPAIPAIGMSADPRLTPRGMCDQLARNTLPPNAVRMFSYGERDNASPRNVGTHAPCCKTARSRTLECETDAYKYINKGDCKVNA